MSAVSEKSATAFRTIGEVAAELGLPQHRLRYWESRFSELRPVTRAGQRRYYRPEDVALVRRIHQLLSEEGYTIRGVQNLLAAERGKPVVEDPLRRIRAMLADALAADAR
ncbi:MerR family transcriptional regulator [Sphingomonas sp. ACRSK]|uniref:MerR family transcriptional regulator n=1 Tax=Sphingomonas sp. ACRSK TaxID=2918213 RepID=UPI001EF5320A|nr:MerR family transcriptional regulator [Sphingomonas sp. ACRSK]